MYRIVFPLTVHIIHSPPSALLWGCWEVTDVREGKEIYSHYEERLHHTLSAEVSIVFNCLMF